MNGRNRRRGEVVRKFTKIHQISVAAMYFLLSRTFHSLKQLDLPELLRSLDASMKDLITVSYTHLTLPTTPYV